MFNVNILDIIKIIPFFANFEKKYNLFRISRDNILVQFAIKIANILK